MQVLSRKSTLDSSPQHVTTRAPSPSPHRITVMAPAAEGVVVKTPSERSAIPLSAAPNNVFAHSDATLGQHRQHVWTNYYELPVEYTVEIHHGILDVDNPTLATRDMPAGLNRRFCVVDATVFELYGEKIVAYFDAHDVELKVVLLEGEECNKVWGAVEKVVNAVAEFGLLRREPIVGIGGGCVLDIVGFAASCYRRGVPYIRVPTTLLAIVDASVGVKCGVDWVHPRLGGLKNRVGAFYAPRAAFLDKMFIGTQDVRNVVNGMGEIMKLALVRSRELFELLERFGEVLVRERFGGEVADRVIELSIRIMLEELGPNLWEYKLERCVDYGHTFSKILEMGGGDIMHGEAVNVDGFLCVLLAWRKGWISSEIKERVWAVMRKMGLPTWHQDVGLKMMKKAIRDGIEHRHGRLRMPLVKGDIGNYGFVNECSDQELREVLKEALRLHPEAPPSHEM